jgi:perosamine synthetase
MTKRLALLGGTPEIGAPLPPYPSIGKAEKEAVATVMERGVLSGFYGSPGPEFNGGPEVIALETEWAARFGVGHAVSVNSATSGLLAAVGAAGVGPGDEVIVPPYTMSATAVAPLFYGGIPVFADIDDETFCLDIEAVKAAITPRTKAIIAVNLFGHPAPLSALRQIADERNIVLIEDNAQSPLGREGNRYTGTIGHIGVFSLNYHKHVHCGEGGICTTDSADLAQRMRLIRNHGENAHTAFGYSDAANLIGLNLRLSELSAAIARSQLAVADRHVDLRIALAERLTAAVAGRPGITAPAVRHDCRHVYYLWSAKIDQDAIGLPRALISKALTAEGFANFEGYVAPLYRLPVFRDRRAIGFNGWPFSLQANAADPYCPVAERLWSKQLLCFEVCAPAIDPDIIEKLTFAVEKVFDGLDQLRNMAAE